MNHATIKIHQSIEEAPIYREPEFIGVQITGYEIVKKGMATGKVSVDVILIDEKGQKYAALTTGSLLKALVIAINNAEGH